MFINGKFMFPVLKFEADKGGGGGGAAPTVEELQAQLAAANKAKEDALKEAADLKSKQNNTPPPEKDNDLRKKAQDEREAAEKQNAATKEIEAALTFNMGMDEFLKSNKDIFPKEIEDIVKVAAKENFIDAKEKANTLKASIIQSFFSIQSNLESLTATQKDRVADFLKLTKTGREQNAAKIFDDVFEPTLETIKKVKKADELAKARSGHAGSSEARDAYKQRLIDNAKRVFINKRSK